MKIEDVLTRSTAQGVGGLREALTRSLRSVKLDVFVELREDNFHLYEV